MTVLTKGQYLKIRVQEGPDLFGIEFINFRLGYFTKNKPMWAEFNWAVVPYMLPQTQARCIEEILNSLHSSLRSYYAKEN